MEDFLVFRRMVTPILIQIVYWILTLAAIGGGIFLLSEDGDEQKVAGLLLLLLGPLVVRIYAELTILGFRMNETLTEIRNNTAPYGRSREGQLGGSPRDSDEAIRLDPQNAEAYSSRGTAYSDNGEYQRAIEDFNEAIRLDPDALDYNDRGSAYYYLGEYLQALEDFNEAIRLDSQYAVAYANRALTYIHLANDVDAQRDVERAIQLGSDRGPLESAIEEARE